MNKFAHTRAFLTSVLLLLSCWATLGAAETGSSQSIETGLRDHVIPDQYIVLFRDRVAKPRWLASELAQRYGFRSRHVFRSVLRGFVAKMPQWVARTLARLPDVAIVEPDLVATEAQQTIPEGVTRISADLNPLAGIDGIDDRRVNVGIAIIDGGIDLDHQDLNVVWAVDCTGENGCVENTWAPGDLTGNDVRGHGTHVAGTIGALDNGFGVVGVAPGARLAAVKVLGDDGRGTFSDVIAGIDWVAEHSDFIAVANLSLEGVGYLSTLRQAVQRAVDAGVVLVVAAGNADRDILGTDGVINSSPPSESFYCRYVSRSYCKSDTIPAAYPEVATVSATDISSNGIADFSNYAANSENDLHGVPVISEGGAIDLTAPGVSILSSAVNDDTETRSGTSMAAPHVAGAAALYIAETGGRDVNFDGAVNTADVYAIRQALIDSAQAQDDYPSVDPDIRTEAMAYAGGDSVQPLIASFSHECNYLSCDFADTSTAVESTITSRGWDFGDGNVSTDQNPSHTYAAGDTYTVTLTVSNGAGDVDTFTAEVQVTQNAVPTADFSYSCDALACSFTDASSDLDGAIESRSWNFGDGASANDATPSHAYTTAGAYTVTLTVTDNADDSSQIAKTVSVSAPNQQPVARFSASPTSGEAPLQVGFDATASSDGDGTITSYSWDFGDGTGGSGVTPSHTYAAGGPYTVTLTVTDDDGAEGTATAPITVHQPTGQDSVHVADLDAKTQRYWSWWWATVTVTVRDQQGNPVGGARVTGAWSAIGGATSCDTSSSGVCSLRSNLAGSQVSSLTLRVTDISAAGYAYEPAANMDPDGDSDGTELTVSR